MASVIRVSLDLIDHVPYNFPNMSLPAILKMFVDSEVAMRTIMTGRSPSFRHVY